jgi:hypothetical protein
VTGGGEDDRAAVGELPLCVGDVGRRVGAVLGAAEEENRDVRVDTLTDRRRDVCLREARTRSAHRRCDRPVDRPHIGPRGEAVAPTARSSSAMQVEIRAVVSPCPYSEVARTQYAEGWRTKAGV